MKTYVIYKLTFPNGKVYIGQTCRFKSRMCAHKRNSFHKKRIEYTFLVSKAIRKYGWENIKIEILIHCGEAKADYYEREYIRLLKSQDRNFGYNLGSGGNKNKKASNTTILKMKKNSGMLGVCGERHHSAIKVFQINRQTGHIIKKWGSMVDAGNKLKIGASTISSACRRAQIKTKAGDIRATHYTAGGYIWIYANKYNQIDVAELIKFLNMPVFRSTKQKLNMRNSHLGKTLSKKHIINIKKTRRLKPIIQIHKKTNKKIKNWKSASQAGGMLRIGVNHILESCNGLRKSAGGFKWRFK